MVVCERKSYSPTPETSSGVTSWVIIVGDRESGGCYGTLDSVIGVWFPDNARCLARILCTICAMCGIISLGWNDRGNPSFLTLRYFEIRDVVF